MAVPTGHPGKTRHARRGDRGPLGDGPHPRAGGTRILLAWDACRCEEGLYGMRLRHGEEKMGTPGTAASVHCWGSDGTTGDGRSGAVPHRGASTV